MKFVEWYFINRKRFNTLELPNVENKNEILRKIINVSYEMYLELNYGIADIQYMPSISLSDEDLDKWYYYIIGMAKENVAFTYGLYEPHEEELKRRSLTK